MNFDMPLSLYLQNNLRVPWLDNVNRFITGLGNWGIFWIVFCVILLCFKKTRYIGVVCTVAFILDYFLVEIIKHLVNRPRPFQANPAIKLIIKAPTGSSFPSAHSSIAFTVATVYMVLGNNKPNNIIRWFILILACLIAFSRVYLFVHYTSDILAGAFIGIATGLLTVFFMRSYIHKQRSLQKRAQKLL